MDGTKLFSVKGGELLVSIFRELNEVFLEEAKDFASRVRGHVEIVNLLLLVVHLPISAHLNELVLSLAKVEGRRLLRELHDVVELSLEGGLGLHDGSHNSLGQTDLQVI